ncbi:MAG: ABC transporter permease [Lachnospiraceae bacterium]|nr:ABC transporter permease [Lachnospiraceae bacterium]
MHIKMIYKYSASRTLHKLLLYLITVFLCFMTFALFLISIFAWRFAKQARTACDKSLNGGIRQAGLIEIVDFSEEYEDAVYSFVQEASQSEAIMGIGSTAFYDSEEASLVQLREKQMQLEKKNSDGLSVFCMNREAANICNMKLQSGKWPEEYEPEEGSSLIYLGSGFTDIPVGTTYEEKDDSGKVIHTNYVAGILEKGTNWIVEEIYLDDSIADAHYVVNMDHQVIEIIDYICSFRMTYTVKQGYSVKEAEEKLRSLAEQHGLNVQFGVLEDILREKESRQSYIFQTLKKMLMVIIFTVFILLLCTQLAEMLEDMQYFGIFYANGASTRDLAFILLGENFLKILVSFFLAAIAVYFAIKHAWGLYQPGVEKWKDAVEIYCKQTIGTAFLLGSILSVLATMIPILWLKKKSPMELIGGYEV